VGEEGDKEDGEESDGEEGDGEGEREGEDKGQHYEVRASEKSMSVDTDGWEDNFLAVAMSEECTFVTAMEGPPSDFSDVVDMVLEVDLRTATFTEKEVHTPLDVLDTEPLKAFDMGGSMELAMTTTEEKGLTTLADEPMLELAE
jgi:hypothetical protein